MARNKGAATSKRQDLERDMVNDLITYETERELSHITCIVTYHAGSHQLISS